jgi:inosine/xanthosine triphosphate pyrophosphatase family protein
MILVTSNSSKRREFERFKIPGLIIQEGPDIREIVSTPDQIIVHKAIDAGEGRVVEDAIIVVDGVPIIDVKWQIEAILKGKYPVGTKIDWQVRLGVVREGRVDTFFGVTEGTICDATEDGFGIDPVLLVNGTGKTLARLDKEGDKDPISARRLAVENLITGNVAFSINAADVKLWVGAYQNE